MITKNPIELFFLWFFSQTPVLYISFVPIVALAFLIALIQISTQRK